jgi:branched-chain amino acid transport system substrate-binding protein
MHRVRQFVVGAALIAAIAGASSALLAADAKIGAVFPLSGPNADYGDTFMTGSNLAVTHVNADKMLSGTLSIVYEDSAATPQKGVIAANKLVNVDQVPYLLSAFTGVSKAVAPVAIKSKTPAINGGAVGPDLATLGDYFWNVIPLADFELRTILPYLTKNRGAKKFVLIYVDDPLGDAMKSGLEKDLPGLGAQLVAALSIPPTAQQFASIAARVREVSPDVVYIASYGLQQSQIIKQLRDNGVSQQLAGYSGMGLPAIMQLPEAAGLLYTSQSVNLGAEDALTKRFVTDYKATHNKEPGPYVVNYYNAVILFAQLASELEKKKQPITGENLLKQRLDTNEFKFVGGTVAFEKNGTVVSPIQINEVDGKGGSKIVN